MSVFGQYAPYDFDWTGKPDQVARQFIDLIARFAPDFPDVLEHYEVLGPPDIEQRIGLTAGNIFQGETMPDQMWEHRLSSRTPVPGVYLRRRHPPGGKRDRAQRPQRGDGRPGGRPQRCRSHGDVTHFPARWHGGCLRHGG